MLTKITPRDTKQLSIFIKQHSLILILMLTLQKHTAVLSEPLLIRQVEV